MLTPVVFFIALALAVFSYSQGQGGPVAGLAFFGVLFFGIHIKQLGEAGTLAGRACRRAGKWFFLADLEDVKPKSACGIAIVLIFALTLVVGFEFGRELAEGENESRYVCQEMKPESVVVERDSTVAQVDGLSSQDLRKSLDDLCDEAQAAAASDGIAMSYYIIGAIGVLLAFGNMAARGFGPAGFTGATISVAVVSSRIGFYGDTWWWIPGVIFILLVALSIGLRVFEAGKGPRIGASK